MSSTKQVTRPGQVQRRCSDRFGVLVHGASHLSDRRSEPLSDLADEWELGQLSVGRHPQPEPVSELTVLYQPDRLAEKRPGHTLRELGAAGVSPDEIRQVHHPA